MRLARSVPVVALSLALSNVVACSGDDGADPAFRRAAGFYVLTHVNDAAPPVPLQTPQGTTFITRGTMQLHEDGRFAMGIEQNFAAGTRPAAWLLVNGRYALQGTDGAMTVTVDQPAQGASGVLAATLSDKQATVPMLGARLRFARP
jgi:hypothetical protein